MAGLEDNSMVGRTFEHRKADAVATPARSARPSVAGRMFLAVICGAFFGGALSVIVAPGLLVAFVLCGAMTFGAGAVALFLMMSDDPVPQGNARTEEEVRQALAEIKGQD
ncbi:hypothetical protein [uncultured Tateyamaria sp.]|uniref:hypothetical protein n=1 Tax=uncultured Tateyamaria sp. TaxID=455651 RepID=UPI002606C1AE|nr:hypothetical protein [uncultured Tateyamaria sp.]